MNHRAANASFVLSATPQRAIIGAMVLRMGSRLRSTKVIFVLLALSSTAILALGAYLLAHRSGLDRTEVQAEQVLDRAEDRLLGQLGRFRYLPALLARHPDIGAVATDPGPDATDRGNRVMQTLADISGALDIYVMDLDGTTVAASNWALDRSFVGRNFSYRPYFQRAVRGGLGYYHAVGTTSGQRGYYFAHPIQDGSGAIRGVIVVKVDLERIETSWRGDKEVLFFSDDNGVIFLSNRDGLILTQFPGTVLRDDHDARQYAGLHPRPPMPVALSDSWGHRIWSESPVAGLPAAGMLVTRPVLRLGLDAHVLVDTSPAQRIAGLWAGLVAALAGAVWLGLAILLERRRALAMRLAVEARANAALEARVQRRTEALSEKNLQLEAEIAERLAAERELRLVQDQLVQAGKLTALGEMSAGISHELNQPLAAIQSLADNGEILIERGRTEEVAANISKISQLAGRMGRIIRNLRAFARKEGEETFDVDIVSVVNDALGIAAGRLMRARVNVVWDPPEVQLVRGGRVRLQQVVVNLVSNAIDAMEGQVREKRIEITLSAVGDRVLLVVRDTGPGLDAADKVFDPFYTTKTVGEGLGLGLSISYGIVQSFGGDIYGATHEDGGAVFTISLKAASGAEAAA